MNDTSNSKTGLLNELLANNSRYAMTFDKPMSLGVKKKVCSSSGAGRMTWPWPTWQGLARLASSDCAHPGTCIALHCTVQCDSCICYCYKHLSLPYLQPHTLRSVINPKCTLHLAALHHLALHAQHSFAWHSSCIPGVVLCHVLCHMLDCRRLQ